MIQASKDLLVRMMLTILIQITLWIKYLCLLRNNPISRVDPSCYGWYDVLAWVGLGIVVVAATVLTADVAGAITGGLIGGCASVLTKIVGSGPTKYLRQSLSKIMASSVVMGTVYLFTNGDIKQDSIFWIYELPELISHSIQIVIEYLSK